MKIKKAWLVAAIALVVLLAAVAMVMSSGQQVEVVLAEKGTFTQVIEETGYVQVIEEQQIQAAQTAKISQILLVAGDRVEIGQLVMVLTSPELEAELASVRSQLAQAEVQLEAAKLDLASGQAQLKQAQDNLARKKALLDAGALAEAEYEAAQLEVSQIENQLAQLESSVAGLSKQLQNQEQMLDALLRKNTELEVRSGVEGILLDVPVKEGQMVGPGTLLAQIAAGKGMEVKTELLSDEIRSVQVGQKAAITSPVLGEESLSGQVAKIYPQAYERVSALGVVQRRVPVLISLDETGNLRPGYEVRVSIETLRKENVVLLPREAVQVNSDGSYQVMKVVDNRMVIQPVQIGEKNQQFVEVLSGIEPGQLVVRDGSLDLKEGARLKPVQP